MIQPLKTPARLETPTAFGRSAEQVERSLHELGVANRLCGGARSVLRYLAPLARRSRPGDCLTLLDVGTGSGDIPRAVVEWGRARRMRWRIVALDRHPQVIARAAALSRDYPEITHVRADVLALPFGERAFDVVVSSMLAHYFASEDVARMLARLASLARRVLVVADVERHWAPYAAIEVLSRASRERWIRRGFNDTVLRGFTPGELEALAGHAGLDGCRVYRHFPYRLVLVAHRD